eukprot:3907375-Heterocapsa_arctica.AAC.1
MQTHPQEREQPIALGSVLETGRRTVTMRRERSKVTEEASINEHWISLRMKNVATTKNRMNAEGPPGHNGSSPMLVPTTSSRSREAVCFDGPQPRRTDLMERFSSSLSAGPQS